jgi:hypothetical protein
MTPTEFVYVTGNLNVTTPERAEQVLAAFKEADRGHKVITVYVLGSMFGPSVHEDAMMRFMKELPGRKILIPGPACTETERKLKYWFGVHDNVELQLWGKTFFIEALHHEVSWPDALIIHADPGSLGLDTADAVDASWEHWSDQFGPGGLQNLYALSVLAEQIGAGMACPETREPV